MDNLKGDLSNFFSARCERALTESLKYQELQNKCILAKNDEEKLMELRDEMGELSEELCYMQGLIDGMKITLKS